MRYELSDYEWSVIKPMLPNKPRGIPRVDDRRILNGIFWVLRSGAPWRDLPDSYGPPTTCYNRFVRWRRAGIWDLIMDALATAHDAAVQMIDTSIVRVHQHGACIANNSGQHIGRSRGGLTSKIHVVVDGNGLPVQLGLTGGQVHDNRLCSVLLRQLPRRARLLADRGYDANWIRAFITERGAWANIPPKRNRKDPICFSLNVRKVLEPANKPVQHNYFLASGLASVVAIGKNGDRLEVGIIGREGMTGLPVVLGNDRSPNETFIQVEGSGARIAADDLRQVMRKSASLSRVLLNFVNAFLIQTSHTALSNGTASVAERLARWLLMAQDRLDGNEIPLTHEFLSLMLGVRRAGVTQTLNQLHRKGLIRLSRGRIEIADRDGLIDSANGTYGIPEAMARKNGIAV